MILYRGIRFTTLFTLAWLVHRTTAALVRQTRFRSIRRSPEPSPRELDGLAGTLSTRRAISCRSCHFWDGRDSSETRERVSRPVRSHRVIAVAHWRLTPPRDAQLHLRPRYDRDCAGLVEQSGLRRGRRDSSTARPSRESVKHRTWATEPSSRELLRFVLVSMYTVCCDIESHLWWILLLLIDSLYETVAVSTAARHRGGPSQRSNRSVVRRRLRRPSMVLRWLRRARRTGFTTPVGPLHSVAL